MPDVSMVPLCNSFVIEPALRAGVDTDHGTSVAVEQTFVNTVSVSVVWIVGIIN